MPAPLRPNDPVVVVGSWTGAEARAFQAVLDHFSAATGIDYVYHGSRALDELLRADVRNGTPPDIAVVASPTELAGYFRNGDLRPLDGVLPPRSRAYGHGWLRLMRTAGAPEHQYAVVLRADLKSVVWYDPEKLPTALPSAETRNPRPSWTQLTALGKDGATPWCMGMGANSSSGFPGTDWIEQIMLAKYGPAVYQRWADGALPWTSPQVETAFTIWGRFLDGVRGGGPAALLTNFADAGRPMFRDPPGCYLDSEGSFIMGYYAAHHGTLRPGRDYDFFPFPSVNPRSGHAYEVAGNFAGMFLDSPAARKLMRFLASTQGQRLWAEHGSFSVNRQVPPGAYPDMVHRKVAAILTKDDALCFDASDLMPAAMGTAFFQAALRFATDPDDHDALARSLQRLEHERQQVYHGTALDFRCGQY